MTKTIKYPGLSAEMARRGETQEKLAEILGLSRPTVNMKLSGKIDWSIGEIEKLCEHFKKDYYQLFK